MSNPKRLSVLAVLLLLLLALMMFSFSLRQINAVASSAAQEPEPSGAPSPTTPSTQLTQPSTAPRRADELNGKGARGAKSDGKTIIDGLQVRGMEVSPSDGEKVPIEPRNNTPLYLGPNPPPVELLDPPAKQNTEGPVVSPDSNEPVKM